MRQTLQTAALLLLLALPASAQEAISLTFDWRPGLSATVTQTLEQASGAAGMQTTQRTVARHTIETAEHPSGLVIRFREGELLESDLPAMQGVPQAEAFTRTVAEAAYDVVVDPQGEVVAIERDEATMERLRGALEEMLEPLRAMPASEGMIEMMENMISEGALNAEARQTWSSSVGLWAEDELVVGETYTSREEAPFPLMQNRTLLMDVETTLEGRVPCTEGASPDSCVKLRVRSAADPDDIRPMMEEMFAEMFAGAPTEMQFEFGEFEQSSVVEAIVEPGTLVPHTVTVTSNADIELSVMGQTIPTVQSTELVIRYDWQGR